jgi:hypothetical protein
MPVLLDSGKSKKGWSYYAPFFRCLHFGGLVQLGLDDRTDPLTRGTMGHLAVGHQLARWMLESRGQDPDYYYQPEAAVYEWCVRNPDGWEQYDRMIECFRRYMAKFPERPAAEIVGVEHAVQGVVGYLGGQWGLWATPNEEELHKPAPVHVSGNLIQPAPLDCPGHPEHGQNVYITRKWDHVLRDRRSTYIPDLKFKAVEVNKFTAKKYAMSGEFAVTRILGAQIFPDFKEAQLTIIQSDEPWAVVPRITVPASPHRDSLFPLHLWRKAHEIAFLERDYPDPHTWPMAQNEVSCVGRYEKDGCPAAQACMYGREMFEQVKRAK